MMARMGDGGLPPDAWGSIPPEAVRLRSTSTAKQALASLSLLERGDLKRIRGVAVACNCRRTSPNALPIEHGMLDAGLPADVTPKRERGAGPGAGLFLVAEYEHSLGLLGARAKGKPSEQVADDASAAIPRITRARRSTSIWLINCSADGAGGGRSSSARTA
jgi:RNA 3'-terminal phosphate cyclase (ATP)